MLPVLLSIQRLNNSDTSDKIWFFIVLKFKIWSSRFEPEGLTEQNAFQNLSFWGRLLRLH